MIILIHLILWAIFLSLGINNPSLNYWPINSWFQPPIIFTTFNLPIIVINTNGQNIADDPRITCDMGIINNGTGAINSLNDSFNDYLLSAFYIEGVLHNLFQKNHML